MTDEETIEILKNINEQYSTLPQVGRDAALSLAKRIEEQYRLQYELVKDLVSKIQVFDFGAN